MSLRAPFQPQIALSSSLPFLYFLFYLRHLDQVIPTCKSLQCIVYTFLMASTLSVSHKDYLGPFVISLSG